MGFIDLKDLLTSSEYCIAPRRETFAPPATNEDMVVKYAWSPKTSNQLGPLYKGLSLFVQAALNSFCIPNKALFVSCKNVFKFSDAVSDNMVAAPSFTNPLTVLSFLFKYFNKESVKILVGINSVPTSNKALMFEFFFA